MTNIDVFHFDDDKENFEDRSHKNGRNWWYARDLMLFLDYSSYQSFQKVINRAIGACMTLDIEILGNFDQVKREINGHLVSDYKLSKFACYLIAMNGDPKKEQVAKAQVYFVTAAETLRHHLEEHENLERLHIRDQISEREKTLSGVANSHGVTSYPLFQNAGYRGMYNKNITELKKYKGLQNTRRTLLDFMGKQELAANLFRITQTEAKITNDDIHGQKRLENAAETIGKQVRKAMREMSGTRPEDLPLSEDLNKVKTSLKGTNRKLSGAKKKKKKSDNKDE